MNETVPDSFNSYENVVFPNSVQIVRANDGYVWLIALCGEGANGGNDDYIPCYRRSGSANSVNFTNGHDEMGTRLVDDEIGPWIWAVPDPINPDRIICNSPQDNKVIPYNVTSGLAETLIPDPAADVKDKTINWEVNMSGVIDDSGNLHMASNDNVAASEHTEYSRWYWDGSAWILSVIDIEIFAGVSYGVSIGIARGSPNTLFIVYKSTSGGIWMKKASTGTTVASDWAGPIELQPAGTRPNVAFSVVPPQPLAYVFEDSGYVKFGRIVTSTFPDPTITSVSPVTVGIGAGIVDSGVDASYDIVINGSNFLNGPPAPGVQFERNGITVDGITITSVTFVSSSQIQAHFTVSQAVSAGSMDLRLSNYDAREVFKIGIVTVTVPTSELTYPVEPILYSSGIASISGTSSFSPVVNQSTITPQIRIIRNSDSYQWDSTGYVNPVTAGQQWLQATNGIPVWNHTGWPNNDTAQTGGQGFTLESRGRTNDRGFGNPSGAINFTIDKTGPAINFTAPLANSSNNSLTAIQGTSADSLVGVKRTQMQVIDSVNNVFNDADDQYWTGYDATGFQSATTWYYVVKQPAPGELANWSCGNECSNKSFNWAVKAVPDVADQTKLPAWTDGRKYKITSVAADKFEDVSVHVSTSPSREFYYDITKPTVSVIIPEQLMPAEPSGLDDPNNVWRSVFNTLKADFKDNVTDPVIGKRNLYYCIYEQGGTDKWGTDCAAASPVFTYEQYAPTEDPYTFNINVSTNWKDGFWYNVAVYGQDAAGNSTGTATSPAVKGYFYYDQGVPTNEITFPVAGGYYGLNSLSVLQGTAKDSISKVGKVEYRLEHPPLAKWSKTSLNWIDQTDSIWNLAGTTTTVPYDVWQSSEVAQAGKWLSGEEYTFIAKSRDKALNYATVYSTVVFKYDATAPATVVLNPIDNGTYSDNTLTNISGTSKDMPDTTRQTGLNMTCIGIQRQSDLLWWNGTANGWQAARNDSCQTPAADWVHQSMGGFWTGVPSADEFKAYAWSQDNVNLPDTSYRNIESSTSLKRGFKYEIQAPSSTIVSPIDDEWYSNESGYQLTSIKGSAIDNPVSGLASGGSISNMQVEVKDDVDLTCWNGTDFSGTCGSANTWKDMALVADSTYSYNTSTLFAATINGRPYKVKTRAFDSALDKDNVLSPNVESVFQQGRNQVTFRADKAPPSSLIQIPNIENVTILDSVSGTAQDTNTQIKKVQVAYYSITDSKWWDPVNKTFTLGGTDPSESAFVDASTNTANPVNWSVTGSSIPSLTNNQRYRIFARAMDKVGNKTVFPGQANVTIPPSQSEFIEIKKITPAPDSTINTPPAGSPYYKPVDLSVINGTLSGGNTVQIRIINITPEPDTVWTPGGWVSTVTYLAGCTDETYVVGESTCGFFGVETISGSDWSKNVSGIWPGGTNQFSVKSRAAADVTLEPTPYAERYFYIDGDDPSTTLVEPNAQYEKSVSSIFGTAQDTGVGKLLNVEITITTSAQSSYWNGTGWVSGAYWFSVTANDGAFDSNNEAWYFNSPLPVFENSKTYEVQVKITDKANRITYYPSPYRSFTIDIASPTARILVPPNGTTGINSIGSISGTAYDNGKNESVQIAIQKWGSPQLWYDGSGFNKLQDEPYWNYTGAGNGFLSPDATSWIYSPAGLDTSFSGGVKYLILTRSTDVAGNLQESFSIGISSMIIYVDKAAPVTSITLPADDSDGISGRYKSANIGKDATGSRFYGSATDNYYTANNAGPEKTQIRLSYLLSGDTYYWTGASFSSGTAAELAAWRNASGAGSWIYVENDITWPAGDREYKLETKSMDATRLADGTGDGNWEQPPYPTKKFIVDDTLPLIGISSPTELSLNSNTDIFGTANADIAGFKQSDIRISTTGAEGIRYWNSSLSQWQPGEYWIQTAKLGPTSWYYTVDPAILKENITYTFEARALDYAQNYSNIYSTKTFLNQRPSTKILNPSAAAYNSLTQLNGTAEDNIGVSEVKITAYKIEDTQYYDPSQASPWINGLESNAPWVPVNTTLYVSSADWSYNVSNSTWTSGKTFRIRAKSKDKAENWDVVLSTKTFIFDTNLPVSTVTYPVDGAHYNDSIKPLTITGTSFDYPLGTKAGVNEIAIYLIRKSDGWYWTGSGWQSGVYPFSITPPFDPWTRAIGDDAFLNNDGEIFQIQTKARDGATNDEGYGLKTSFVYDLTKPTGTITYPYNNGYISQTGKIAGTAYDTPNGKTGNVFVRVKKTVAALDYYWRISDSSWALAEPDTWNEIPAYGTLSPNGTWWQLNTSPWQTGETYEMNIYAKDKANNYQIAYSTVTDIKADFTAPSSTVTYPVHGTTLEAELTKIEGSASDYSPGILDKVHVSYKCVDTNYCDTSLNKYWNRTAGAWDSASEIFYEATILAGNKWEATGNSTPTWITNANGVDYEIFAKGVDQAGNEVTKPGSPAADTSYIKFKLKPPPPVSGITTPNDSIPHWKPASVPVISGTALYSTTVQLRIIDYGADLAENAGNDDLAWNGSIWLSTNSFTGFVGVDSYNTVTKIWQWSITSDKWNVNRKYRVISKALATGMPDEVPGTGREFVVDSLNPAASITQPDKSYLVALATVTANVSDTAPGAVQSGYFRVKRQESSQYWNWKTSTFTALSGSDTDLTATINLGIAQYSTDYFKTGQAWETNRSYAAQFYLQDKAGNTGSASERTFTIDKASPTAVILVPSDANKSGIRYIPSISGTASDNWGNNNIQIAIQQWDGSNNLWFNGTSFNQGSIYWISMAANGYLSPNATYWAYSPSGLDAKFIPGASGFKYLILAKAEDVAGNVQETYIVDASSVVIKIDKAAPSSAMTDYPLDDLDGVSGRYKSQNIGKSASASRFKGTTQDSYYTQNNSTVAATQIRLSYLSAGDTYYWNEGANNFSSWTVTENTAWFDSLLSGSGPVWNWLYLSDINWPSGDREYKLETKSMDDARLNDDTGDGNWENPQSRGTNIRYFIIDDNPPSVLITSPTTGGVNYLTQVYGTANADIAGFNKTEIKVSTGSGADTRYWNGSGWQTGDWPPLTTTRLGPTSWYYTVDAPMLKDDVVYTFVARSLDYAGNYASIYSTYTVTYDTTAPNVSITYPINGDTYSGVKFSTPVAGGVSNTQSSPNTGVSSVTVAVSQVTGVANDYATCFNGASFIGCGSPIWLSYTGGTLDPDWEFNDSDISFISDKKYKYEARSIDIAQNISAVSNVITYFDLDKPTSTVLSPSAEYVNSIPMVSGEANDERFGPRDYEAKLGTYTVKVAIKLVGGNWWLEDISPAFDSGQPVWYETSVDTFNYISGFSTVTWTYNLSTDLQTAISNLGTTVPRKDYWFVTYAYDLAL
ncbi:MAG: hypothetical protein HY746_06650, partial [Elusimicrobia bacterium]|nr:hypothetical protein [Elusimicrobiota bacterium]